MQFYGAKFVLSFTQKQPLPCLRFVWFVWMDLNHQMVFVAVDVASLGRNRSQLHHEGIRIEGCSVPPLSDFALVQASVEDLN